MTARAEKVWVGWEKKQLYTDWSFTWFCTRSKANLIINEGFCSAAKHFYEICKRWSYVNNSYNLAAEREKSEITMLEIGGEQRRKKS